MGRDMEKFVRNGRILLVKIIGVVAVYICSQPYLVNLGVENVSLYSYLMAVTSYGAFSMFGEVLKGELTRHKGRAILSVIVGWVFGNVAAGYIVLPQQFHYAAAAGIMLIIYGALALRSDMQDSVL